MENQYSLQQETNQKQLDTEYETYREKCDKEGSKCMPYDKWLSNRANKEKIKESKIMKLTKSDLEKRYLYECQKAGIEPTQEGFDSLVGAVEENCDSMP